MTTFFQKAVLRIHRDSSLHFRIHKPTILKAILKYLKMDKIVQLNSKSLKALELVKVLRRSDHQTKALWKRFEVGLTKVACD